MRGRIPSIARIVAAAAFAALTVTASAATPVEAALADARAAWSRGDLKAADRIVGDALRRFAASDADDAWSLRVLRADILNSTASCDDAISYIATVRLPPRLGRARQAVDRLTALGLAQWHCSRLTDARASFAAAQKIARRLDTDAAGKVLLRKGDFEISTHAWNEAEADVRALLALAKKARQPRLEARGWAALGKLRGQQERYDEAIDGNERALAIAAANGDALLALIVRMNLGWLYVASGDYQRAIEMLTAADAEQARLGRKGDRVIALMQLGNAYLDQNRPEEARAFYQQALAIANELHHPARAFLLDNLARVDFAAGAFGKAQVLNQQAIVLHREQRETDAAMRSLALSGRIAERLGRTTEAEGLYRRVIAEATSRLARLEAWYFLAEFDANHGKRPAAETAFRNALALADAARGELQSEELKLAYTTTLDAVVNDFIEYLIVDGRAADALRVAESSRARALAEGLGAAPRARAVDVRGVARERGTILSYWLTPKVSFLWAVTPSSIDVYRLPPAPEIASAVDGYQRELAGPRGTLQFTAARGEQLWSMLVAPAASHLGAANRVVIVADKHLYALNFETLIVPAPRPHYWIEDATITTASSIDLLASANRAAPNRGSMLLIGDPTPEDRTLPPLPWARTEMQRVRAHFADATVIAGPRATADAYLDTVTRRYGFVHFVAHGIGNTTRPLDSAIVLGNKLYAREILKHRLNARLVTISSCHGAGQRAFAGEGLVGLAWAFLRAGAHQVVAALWEVSDSATPQLMDAMYGAIERGEDPAAALREAKLALLRSNTVYRRPLYWAPFVLYAGA